MNVVGLAVHFNELRFKICTDLLKVISKSSKSVVVEDRTTVFGDEDQMNMHLENTMPTVSDFA